MMQTVGSDFPSCSRRIAIVVEDNVATRRTFLTVLRQLSFDAIGFGSAEAALAWLEMNAVPSLLSVDLRLPGMSGRQLIECVRNHPRLRSVPIMMISGSADADAEGAALLFDCASLIKPFRVAEYAATVERIAPQERTARVTPRWSLTQSLHFWARAMGKAS